MADKPKLSCIHICHVFLIYPFNHGAAVIFSPERGWKIGASASWVFSSGLREAVGSRKLEVKMFKPAVFVCISLLHCKVLVSSGNHKWRAESLGVVRDLPLIAALVIFYDVCSLVCVAEGPVYMRVTVTRTLCITKVVKELQTVPLHYNTGWQWYHEADSGSQWTCRTAWSSSPSSWTRVDLFLWWMDSSNNRLIINVRSFCLGKREMTGWCALWHHIY